MLHSMLYTFDEPYFYVKLFFDILTCSYGRFINCDIITLRCSVTILHFCTTISNHMYTRGRERAHVRAWACRLLLGLVKTPGNSRWRLRLKTIITSCKYNTVLNWTNIYVNRSHFVLKPYWGKQFNKRGYLSAIFLPLIVTIFLRVSLVVVVDIFHSKIIFKHINNQRTRVL